MSRKRNRPIRKQGSTGEGASHEPAASLPDPSPAPPGETPKDSAAVSKGNRVAAMVTTLFFAVALPLATLYVFWELPHQKFVGYDDQAYIYENPQMMSGLNARSIQYALTKPVVGNYHPLTVLSMLSDVSLFGLNAGAMKTVNLALHAGSVLLLFFALRKMTGRILASAFVAALFAIHPLHVEPVAWVSSRKDMLSGFFTMAGLLCYAYYARGAAMRRRSSIFWYIAVALLLFLAIMSKPVAVTFPCILLLLDWWPLGRLEKLAERRGLLNSGALLTIEKLPLFVIAALGAYGTIWAQRADKAVAPLQMYSMPVRIENAVLSYGKYILLTIWPHDLSVHYPHPGVNISMPAVLLSLAALLAITAAIFFFGKKRPWLWVGWLWFLGVLVPMIGIMQVGSQAMADRYMYLPQIGLTLMVAWTAVEIMERSKRPLFMMIILAVLAFAAIEGYEIAAKKQVSYWNDSETLFGHCVAVDPDNARMQNSLGSTLIESGRPDEAEPHLREAIRLEPTSANQRTNLGTILMDRGKLDEAIALFRESLRYEPDHVRSYFNLGSALYRKSDINGAAECYLKAARLEPTYLDAWFWAGNALMDANRPAEAIPCYERVLAMTPGNTDAAARLTQARSLAQQPGQTVVQNPVTPDAARAGAEETVARMRERIAARPEDSASYFDLGKALFSLSRYDEAVEAFKKVIERAPNNAHAWYQLGNCHISMGNAAEAKKAYEEAIRLEPAHVYAHGNLGTALLNLGDVDGAIREYGEAIRLDSTYADGHNNLGTVYYQQGRYAESAAEFEQALAANPTQPNAKENLERAKAMLNPAPK